jgi:DNA polymerase, archaea type
MPTIHCYPIDATYKIINKQLFLLIFARTLDNKKICLIEREYKPYFYVHEKKEDLESYLGDLMILYEKGKGTKVFVANPNDIPRLAGAIEQMGFTVSDSDLPYIRKYFLDKEITPLCLIEVDIESYPMNVRVPSFEIRSIRSISYEVLEEPAVIHVAIEKKGRSFEKNKPITHIAILGKGINKVITWKEAKGSNILKVASESELLETFLDQIEKIKPDFLNGYFMDDMLSYILDRAAIYKLDKAMGLDDSRPVYTESHKSNKINGINIFDSYKFIKRFLFLNLDDFTLENVAGYLTKEDITETYDKITTLSQEVHLLNALFHELYYYLTELVKPTGVVPYYINRLHMSELIDWYIIREVHEKKGVIPKKRYMKKIVEHNHIRYLPKTGLFHNTWKLKIKNLSLSLISHENISPDSIDCECCTRKRREDKNHWFCSWKRGFFATIIKDFLDRYNRIEDLYNTSEENKRLKKRLEVYEKIAYALPYYIYNPSNRWYLKEVAQAFNDLKQDAIEKIVKVGKTHGISIAYADSTELIVYNTTEEQIERYAEEIFRDMHGNVHIQIEGRYDKSLIVFEGCNIKNPPRFAFLKDDRLELKGFNRFTDGWTPLLRDAEHRILELIVKEGDLDHAVGYVNYLIRRIQEKDIATERLIQRSLIKKDPETYGDSIIGKAITRLKNKDIPVRKGMVIAYIIEEGPGSVQDRVRLPGETTKYDPKYYIDSHLISHIFCFFTIFGITLAKDTEGKVISQTKLNEFGKGKDE